MHVGGDRGEALGQRPFAGADLEHDVPGLELRVAHDRVQQVGVDEEVLPQPHHRAAYQPKSARALASTLASSSS